MPEKLIVYNFYDCFSKFGGAQKVCRLLNKHFRLKTESIIVSFSKFNEIHERYRVERSEYEKFTISLLFKLGENAVILSHHRKITTILSLFKKILFRKYKIIHVAHNEFNNLRSVSVFPKNIIAVSNKVKENHCDYFNISKENIKVIYNGVFDYYNGSYKKRTCRSNDIINILYPARVSKVKQQVEIFKALKGSLPGNIRIIFAGDGPQMEELQSLVAGSDQFQALGYVDDIDKLYQMVDYSLLFSKNEGLPMSLIESCMHGIPIICNDVGGNLEIVNENNGFVVNTFDELISCLDNISSLSNCRYAQLSKEARAIYDEKFCEDVMYLSYDKYLTCFMAGN
jgi:glycosyltransferase involved in cell wall biosynthesis